MSTRMITRDALLATRARSFARYAATSDAGGRFFVIGPDGDGAVFAQASLSGLLVRIQRTGRARVRGKGDQVRVRIMPAWDTGDQAGTLAFPAAGGFGGVAPRRLFA